MIAGHLMTAIETGVSGVFLSGGPATRRVMVMLNLT